MYNDWVNDCVLWAVCCFDFIKNISIIIYSDILDILMLIKSRILIDYAKLSQAMLDKISKKSLDGIHDP